MNLNPSTKASLNAKKSNPPQNLCFFNKVQKNKTGAIVSVTSDSSSSDSESEESTSKSASSEASESSDSDGLENWMILGRENQDGDQSISLNLEGVCADGSGATPICSLPFLFPLGAEGDFVFCAFQPGSS